MCSLIEKLEPQEGALTWKLFLVSGESAVLDHSLICGQFQFHSYCHCRNVSLHDNVTSGQDNTVQTFRSL